MRVPLPANDAYVMSTTSVASIREEIASALTHGLGAVFALGAGAVLITLAAIYSDGWQLAGAIVFGIALLLLYTASTLYHAVSSPSLKQTFRTLDHAAIFLLISGSYTPITLVCMGGGWGWTLLGLNWGFALVGIDLAGVEARAVATAALTRLPRVAAGTDAVLLISSSQRIAGATADLAVEMEPASARFERGPDWLEALEVRAHLVRNRTGPTQQVVAVRLRVAA